MAGESRRDRDARRDGSCAPHQRCAGWARFGRRFSGHARRRPRGGAEGTEEVGGVEPRSPGRAKQPLVALCDPATARYVEALEQREFARAPDAPALALLAPILARGLQIAPRSRNDGRPSCAATGPRCAGTAQEQVPAPHLPLFQPLLETFPPWATRTPTCAWPRPPPGASRRRSGRGPRAVHHPPNEGGAVADGARRGATSSPRRGRVPAAKRRIIEARGFVAGLR